MKSTYLRPLALMIVLLAVSAASLFGALLIGTFPISALHVLDSLLFPAPGVVYDVIWQLRAPRAAAAFGCGGLLALAGALTQILFGTAVGHQRRLGVSRAVAAGALIVLVAGVSLALMHAAAFSAVAAALLTGGIGCVGLIAPHALRRMGITQLRWVVPLVVLLGGSLLTIADSMGRWLTAP